MVVLGLAPHLPAPRPLEGAVQRFQDEVVPRRVARRAVVDRHIAIRVEQLAVPTEALARRCGRREESKAPD